MNIMMFGPVDQTAKEQLERCMGTEGKYGVLCADHHVGYSQPIGGAVAYANHISPSGVGYDIGCLAQKTSVLTSEGYHLPIEIVSPGTPIVCWGGKKVRLVKKNQGSIEKGVKKTHRLFLTNGRVLDATPDHEILTQRGWRPLCALTSDDLVACYPHVGFPFEKGTMSTALLRVAGFVAGDGHLSKTKYRVSLYVYDSNDVTGMIFDLKSLGYNPYVYQRERVGKKEYQIVVNSKGLHEILADLGIPIGAKKNRWAKQPFKVLFSEPSWLKAQFLSAFFSAEASTPRLVDGCFTDICVKQATKNSANFISNLMESLSFKTNVVVVGDQYVTQVQGGELGQIQYGERIGFCYALEKRRALAKVLSVVWNAHNSVLLKTIARDLARDMHVGGTSLKYIKENITKRFPVSSNFVHHAIYDDRGTPRITRKETPQSFQGEIVWVPVATTFVSLGKSVPVYDVVTSDPVHSFIANGIVVHNCGNKAVRTPLLAQDVDVPAVMDEIGRQISFGLGRVNKEPVDDPVIGEIAHADFDPQRKLWDLAAEQLGTVGAGNHYVDLFKDEDGVLWIGVHFGSRGFGHKTASGFLALGQGLEFSDHAKEGGMQAPPVLFDISTSLGQDYLSAMTLAGKYAYAGRNWVVNKVLQILGTTAVEEIHNHHNYAWQEYHFGENFWVVRKGCTPAYPGQKGFVGGSMGDISVILEGVDSEESKRALYSTVHGAGRIMSRTQATGRSRYGKKKGEPLIDWDQANRDMKAKGIVLRGGEADEAPGVYRPLQGVLNHHKGTIRILYTLQPIGVHMNPRGLRDPYKE